MRTLGVHNQRLRGNSLSLFVQGRYFERVRGAGLQTLNHFGGVPGPDRLVVVKLGIIVGQLKTEKLFPENAVFYDVQPPLICGRFP
jgi:hypothetical protein